MSSTPSNKKKYKLSAFAPQDGGPPPCAFFVSAAGCRNGDSCKFSHELSSNNNMKQQNDADSVVSSESSIGRGEEKVVAAVKQQVKTNVSEAAPVAKQQQPQQQDIPAASKKAKRKSAAASDAFPFANPKKQKASTPPVAAAAQVPVAAPPAAPPAAAQAKPPKLKAEKVAPPPAAAKVEPKPALKPVVASKKDATPSFRNLLKELPIAAFTMPSDRKEAEQAAEGTAAAALTNEAPPNVVPETAPALEEPPFPLPKSHPDSLKWLSAVQEGHKHPRFVRDYNFIKYQNEDENAGFVGKKGWITAKQYDEATHYNLPQAIAMDCEMCETKDPVSGQKDPRALCRISIVDVVTDEVLLDTLVKPAWPVTDHRTWINGINEKDLENVQFTLRHAQAFMMALCSTETVIMGHALQNDLAAIRMEHYCVVDSALLFSAKDSPGSSVSLKDLASSILDKSMPNKHDSVNDARTAYKCLEHYLEKDGKVEPVERTARTVRKNYSTQLFVHRIPRACDENHLKQMFLAYSCVQPDEVDPIEFKGDMGKTFVTFRSGKHANVAFESIESKPDTDPSGRLQKKVFLKSGGYVRVRKMAYETSKGEKEPPRRASTG